MFSYSLLKAKQDRKAREARHKAAATPSKHHTPQAEEPDKSTHLNMADSQHEPPQSAFVAELDANPSTPKDTVPTDSLKELDLYSTKGKPPSSSNEANTKKPLEEKQVFLPPPDSADDIKPPPPDPAAFEKQTTQSPSTEKQPLTSTSPSSEKQTLSKPDIANLQTTSSSTSTNPSDLPAYASRSNTTTTTHTTPSSLFSHSQTSRSYHEHSFYHLAPWRPTHNTIVDPDNCARYFVEVSEFSKSKPDVTLHDVKGTDHRAAMKGEGLSAEDGKAGRVVAFAQFVSGGESGKVRVGLGDGVRMGSVRWVEMSGLGQKEEWGVVVEGGKEGMERRFEWRAARSGGSGEVDGQAVQGAFRFVDAESKAVYAMYTEAKAFKGLKKRGKMRVYDGMLEGDEVVSGEELELLIMMCACVTNEKRRRKTWRKWGTLGMSGSK